MIFERCHQPSRLIWRPVMCGRSLSVSSSRCFPPPGSEFYLSHPVFESERLGAESRPRRSPACWWGLRFVAPLGSAKGIVRRIGELTYFAADVPSGSRPPPALTPLSTSCKPSIERPHRPGGPQQQTRAGTAGHERHWLEPGAHTGRIRRLFWQRPSDGADR